MTRHLLYFDGKQMATRCGTVPFAMYDTPLISLATCPECRVQATMVRHTDWMDARGNRRDVTTRRLETAKRIDGGLSDA